MFVTLRRTSAKPAQTSALSRGLSLIRDLMQRSRGTWLPSALHPILHPAQPDRHICFSARLLSWPASGLLTLECIFGSRFYDSDWTWLSSIRTEDTAPGVHWRSGRC